MVRLRATNTMRRSSSNGVGGSSSRQRSNRSLRQESTCTTYNHHWWFLQKDGDHSYLRRILGPVAMILVGMAIGIYLVDHRHRQRVDGTYYNVLNAISTTPEKPVAVVTAQNTKPNQRQRQLQQEKNDATRRDEEATTRVERKKQQNNDNKNNKGKRDKTAAKVDKKWNRQDDNALPATGGKAWFWSPKSARDLDHQRQGMFVTWVIAYYTGHAVEHKALPNFKHSDFWNVAALEKYVNVDHVPSDAEDGKIKRKRCTRLYANSTFATVEQVQELKSRYNVGFFTNKLGWNFLPNTFPWLDPFEGPAKSTFRRMIESFTYCEKIQRLADKAIEQMVGTTDEPNDRMNNFIGLEVLSHRKPAVDCKRYKSKTNPGDHKTPFRMDNLNASLPVLPGSCADVDWSNLLAKSKFPAVLAAKLKSSPRKQPTPIYVAHDDAHVAKDDNDNNNNKGSSSFDKKSIRANNKHYKVFTRSDFDFLSRRRGRRPEIVSAVEQVIMTRAKYFVGSMFSTWSEYVIFQRIYNDEAMDGKKNYELWKDKYSYVMKPPDVVALSREAQKSFLVVPSTKNNNKKKAGTSTNKDSSSSKRAAKSRVAKIEVFFLVFNRIIG